MRCCRLWRGCRFRRSLMLLRGRLVLLRGRLVLLRCRLMLLRGRLRYTLCARRSRLTFRLRGRRWFGLRARRLGSRGWLSRTCRVVCRWRGIHTFGLGRRFCSCAVFRSLILVGSRCRDVVFSGFARRRAARSSVVFRRFVLGSFIFCGLVLGCLRLGGLVRLSLILGHSALSRSILCSFVLCRFVLGCLYSPQLYFRRPCSQLPSSRRPCSLRLGSQPELRAPPLHPCRKTRPAWLLPRPPDARDSPTRAFHDFHPPPVGGLFVLQSARVCSA